MNKSVESANAGAFQVHSGWIDYPQPSPPTIGQANGDSGVTCYAHIPTVSPTYLVILKVRILGYPTCFSQILDQYRIHLPVMLSIDLPVHF